MDEKEARLKESEATLFDAWKPQTSPITDEHEMARLIEQDMNNYTGSLEDKAVYIRSQIAELDSSSSLPGKRVIVTGQVVLRSIGLESIGQSDPEVTSQKVYVEELDVTSQGYEARQNSDDSIHIFHRVTTNLMQVYSVPDAVAYFKRDILHIPIDGTVHEAMSEDQNKANLEFMSYYAPELLEECDAALFDTQVNFVDQALQNLSQLDISKYQEMFATSADIPAELCKYVFETLGLQDSVPYILGGIPYYYTKNAEDGIDELRSNGRDCTAYIRKIELLTTPVQNLLENQAFVIRLSVLLADGKTLDTWAPLNPDIKIEPLPTWQLSRQIT